jgi:hypothetical protein
MQIQEKKKKNRYLGDLAVLVAHKSFFEISVELLFPRVDGACN